MEGEQISFGAERLVMSNSSISRSRPHCGLRLRWSSLLVSGRANSVPPEVSERFPDRGFDRLRASFHLAHQHRALNSGDTEVSQPILVSVCRQSTLCLFPDEKGSQLILHDLKEMAEILPDQLVLLRHPIADSSKWTAPRHARFFCSSMCAANHRSKSSQEDRYCDVRHLARIMHRRLADVAQIT